jgi:hypothetical protein
MGIVRGPNIVKDGIVLHFDAASVRSYTDPDTIWNNLQDIDSPYSGSEVGTSISYNTSGYFDIGLGDLSYFDVGSTGFLTGSYTKIAVFYPKGIRNHNFISSDVGTHAFWIDGPDMNQLRSGHNGSFATIVGTLDNDMTDKWNWAGVTFDTTSGWRMYYNGMFVTSSSDTTVISSTPNMRLMQYSNSISNQLSGSFALAMVYNRALSDEEMAQNFNGVKRRFNL